MSPFLSKVQLLCIAGVILFSGCSQAQPGWVEGLPVSKNAYDKELIHQLRDSIEANVYKRLNSIVVLKQGELLMEEYYNGTKRRQVHDVRSVGKTFASAVLGIALDEGHIRSVDQSIAEFYDLKAYQNNHPLKERITLRHLLTMSSNFDGNDNDYDSPGNEENMYPQENWVEWTLNLPIDTTRAAGMEWNYFTAGVVILGDILDKTVPGGLEEYADQKLFQPIGIDRYFWPYTPQQVPNTAGGIRLTPIGFAKFGQLYLQNGNWKGSQVLPESWVKASHTAHIETKFPPNRYGFLWWIKDYVVDGQSYPTEYCTGNGGNKIFVFKEQELVVVVTASAYGRRYMHRQVDEIMERYVLPAVVE